MNQILPKGGRVRLGACATCLLLLAASRPPAQEPKLSRTQPAGAVPVSLAFSPDWDIPATTKAVRRAAAGPPAFASLDRLDPTQIPTEERVAGQPKELVAVLGTQRGRHWGPNWSLVVSPDLTWAATGGFIDGTIRLWDTATLRPRSVLQPKGQAGWVGPIAISPDGKMMAASAFDMSGCFPAPEGVVRLWDLSGGVPRLRGAVEGCGPLAFSPDGKALATGHTDEEPRLWDLGGKQPRERARLPRWGVVPADGPARLWDLGGRVPRERPAAREEASVGLSSLAFTPDGKRLAVTRSAWNPDAKRRELVVCLWEAGGDRPVARAAFLVPDGLGAVAPDGQTVACGEPGGAVRLWDLGGDRPRERVTLPGKAAGLRALVFTLDGKALTLRFEGGHERLWDISGRAPREVGSLRPQVDDETAVVTLLPGGKALSGGVRRGLQLWKLEGGTFRPLPGGGHAADVMTLAFSPDGLTLATGGHDGSVRLWDVGRPRPEIYRTLGGPGSPVRSLAFRPDGKALAVGKEDGVLLWGLTAARRPGEVTLPEASGPVAFAPGGRWLATRGKDVKAVQLWDLAGGKPRAAATLAGSGEVAALAFAPDGKSLACLSQANILLRLKREELRLWDLRADPPRQRAAVSQQPSYRGPGFPGRTLAFSPDGRTLACEEAGKGVRLYEVREDELLEQTTLKGHAHWVTSLALAPSGRALASAGCSTERESFGRCNVVLWDADGRKLRDWAFPGVVCGVAFAPDGRHLATANSNGTVYVLRLAGR